MFVFLFLISFFFFEFLAVSLLFFFTLNMGRSDGRGVTYTEASWKALGYMYEQYYLLIFILSSGKETEHSCKNEISNGNFDSKK